MASHAQALHGSRRALPGRVRGFRQFGRDGVRKDIEYDMTAGKRLQDQRPHPIEKIKDEEGAQEVDTRCGCSGGCDVLAGERLPKQRPQGDDHPEHNSEEHLDAQVPHQDEEAGSIVFHSSSNASEFKNDNKEARVMASAAAKVSEDFPNAEILRTHRGEEKHTQ